VDAVVMHGEMENGATYDLLRAVMKDKSYVAPFSMRLGNESFGALASNHALSAAEFAAMARGRNDAAVAGIANPERFFGPHARLGVAARRLAFPDHHAYRAGELKLPGVDLIVMTEKDAVKCAAFADARMWSMRVDALVDPELAEFLAERLTSRNGPRN
jgi:tetraacyldisaccharide 4'-kinase